MYVIFKQYLESENQSNLQCQWNRNNHRWSRWIQLCSRYGWTPGVMVVVQCSTSSLSTVTCIIPATGCLYPTTFNQRREPTASLIWFLLQRITYESLHTTMQAPQWLFTTSQHLLLKEVKYLLMLGWHRFPKVTYLYNIFLSFLWVFSLTWDNNLYTTLNIAWVMHGDMWNSYKILLINLSNEETTLKI